MLYGDYIRNKVDEYNEHKFSRTINTWLMKPFPVLISPLFGFIVSGVILNLIFIASFMVFKTTGMTSEQKGVAGFVAFVYTIGGFGLFSFLYTILVIYPISRLRKHVNDKKFVFINYCFILFWGVLLFWFLLPQSNISIAHIYIPLILCSIAFLNIFSFKALNEMFKRDKNGNMVYTKDLENSDSK